MGNSFQIVLTGVGLTVVVTVASFALGAIGGIPLVLMRRSKAMLYRGLASAAIDWLRAVPPLVWIFIIFYGIGSGYVHLNPLSAAVLALGMLSSAYMAEIYRGGLLAVEKSQAEAAEALGLSRVDTLRFVLGPQAARISIPAMVTYLIGLLKESSLAATIGVAEIAFRARAEALVTFEGLKVFGYAGIVYVALTLPVAWLARAADKRLRLKVSR